MHRSLKLGFCAANVFLVKDRTCIGAPAGLDQLQGILSTLMFYLNDAKTQARDSTLAHWVDIMAAM